MIIAWRFPPFDVNPGFEHPGEFSIIGRVSDALRQRRVPEPVKLLKMGFSVNQVVGALVRRTPGQRTDLTKADALKFLVHLVGDIHQPLHCGCGYCEVHGHQVVLITDPEKAFHRRLKNRDAPIDRMNDVVIVRELVVVPVNRRPERQIGEVP